MNAIVSPESSVPRPFPQPLFDADAALPAVEDMMDSLALRSANESVADLTGVMAFRQLSSGGKRVRARLALHACAALGVPQDKAVAWAAAVELLHNATLIHDDVQDGDTVRRGEPTIWATYGVAQAINAGDFMLMLPFLAISELPRAERGLLSTALADHATRIVRGQVDELVLNDTKMADAVSYVRACEGKTGALLALPVVGAALLAGLDDERVDALGGPFSKLGLLFQLQDDVVDLFGDKGRQQVGCDIYEGKISALVVELFARRESARDEVTAILSKSRELTTKEDVDRVRSLMLESGALSGVMDQIQSIRREVLSSNALRTEPRLLMVAQTLAEMALAPVEHLLEEAAQ